MRERLEAITHWLMATSGHDAATSRELAYGLLHGGLLRQAFVKAYVDVFWMLTLAFVVFLPFILLLAGRPGRSHEVHGGR